MHLFIRDRLVADHLALRHIRHELAFEENALPRELNADEARQTQRAAAGNKSFLAGCEIEVTTVDGDDTVHDTQELTAAADGMAFHGGEPRILQIIFELFAVGAPESAVRLVEEPKFALKDRRMRSDRNKGGSD